jgi:UDP-N-acetylmuramoylalanine--D-glutamate ligase
MLEKNKQEVSDIKSSVVQQANGNIYNNGMGYNDIRAMIEDVIAIHLPPSQEAQPTFIERFTEFVREINGVKWYNDSIGTSPTRTIAGLNSYVEKIVLIAGGYDKHLEYEPIAKPIVDNVSKLILIGATADKIEKAVKDELAKENKPEDFIPMYRCNTLQEVCEKAKEVAVEGEVVLFSPASASFDMFKNFADRGEQFKKLVEKL